MDMNLRTLQETGTPEEPDVLQSLGLQRAGQDLATDQQQTRGFLLRSKRAAAAEALRPASRDEKGWDGLWCLQRARAGFGGNILKKLCSSLLPVLSPPDRAGPEGAGVLWGPFCLRRIQPTHQLRTPPKPLPSGPDIPEPRSGELVPKQQVGRVNEAPVSLIWGQWTLSFSHRSGL